MIRIATGNLLDARVDALVNTVNTVGIMGKGIALQFKRAYPAMFKDYERLAKAKELSLGTMHVWPTQQLSGPKFVINFPTKGHWKSKSRLRDIEAGLDDLVRVVREFEIRSIAIPPLGCGHGGLDWSEVEPLIRSKLEAIDNVSIELFAPVGAPTASEMKSAGPLPRMTPGRAALITILARYTAVTTDGATPIELQKLMYFLQEAGEPLRLNFNAHHYGPYADNLRHVLTELEGHYVIGFGDGSQRVEFADPIRVLPNAESAADAEISTHPETATRVLRVLNLVDGYESTYSMELLATVHWILSSNPDLIDDSGLVVGAVHSWSDRKKVRYQANHIISAVETLRDRGWTPDRQMINA